MAAVYVSVPSTKQHLTWAGNIPNQGRTAAGTVVQERSSTVGRVEGAGGGVAIER
jgi:hypothetical protein